MTSPPRPPIECEQVHPELVVSDVRAAAEFYTSKLGFQQAFIIGDPPYIAGVNLGNVAMHLLRGTPAPEGCSVYFVVGDADELYRYHLANGVHVLLTPEDRDYGLRDYSVRDLDGHRLGFGHRIGYLGEPVPIERVEVTVRLEKRIVAILHDLAEHKQMSLSSTLEETLLHTFEPLGDGVASPHTARTLRYIQELKQKHGVDYDCHASYHFVEEGREGRETSP
jgi:catechol 2,3-dioxygenase-like lactoylglutathione lyase family enzyme